MRASDSGCLMLVRPVRFDFLEVLLRRIC